MEIFGEWGERAELPSRRAWSRIQFQVAFTQPLWHRGMRLINSLPLPLSPSATPPYTLSVLFTSPLLPPPFSAPPGALSLTPNLTFHPQHPFTTLCQPSLQHLKSMILPVTTTRASGSTLRRCRGHGIARILSRVVGSHPKACEKAILYASAFGMTADGWHTNMRLLKDVTKLELNVAETGSTCFNPLANHGPHAQQEILAFTKNLELSFATSSLADIDLLEHLIKLSACFIDVSVINSPAHLSSAGATSAVFFAPAPCFFPPPNNGFGTAWRLSSAPACP